MNFTNNIEWMQKLLRISEMLFASHFGGACSIFFFFSFWSFIWGRYSTDVTASMLRLDEGGIVVTSTERTRNVYLLENVHSYSVITDGFLRCSKKWRGTLT